VKRSVADRPRGVGLLPVSIAASSKSRAAISCKTTIIGLLLSLAINDFCKNPGRFDKVTALIRRKHFTACLLAMIAVSLIAVATPSAAAKLYKWIDENGEVRYSDRLPAQQSGKKHQELNSQGVVLSTQEEAKSPEELAVEAEAQQKKEAEEREAARIKAMQDQQDRVLLLTYSSIEEIEHARASRIEVIESVIRLIRSNIETTQQKLDGLNKSANRNYLSQGLEIPGGLAQKIEFLERKIANRSAQLEAKLVDKEKINQKYDADLTRYRQLKSASN
jgi:hypothetical protein